MSPSALKALSVCIQALMLTSMQKINLITYFFLKILQRNCKLFILDNLGILDHTQFFLKILQRYCNFVFWELWECLAMNTESDISSCSKLLCLSADKKSTLSPTFSWRYCKIYKLISSTSDKPGYTHSEWL